MNLLRTLLICTFTIFFGTVENVLALQTHGAPEGIYVHQMAHVLFLVALLYLFWHTRKTQETSSQGWRFFQLFCLLLAAWNVLAFTGHETYEALLDSDFVARHGWDARLTAPLTFKKVLYYITKMDHFLIVPALLALVVSLRTLYREAIQGRRA